MNKSFLIVAFVQYLEYRSFFSLHILYTVLAIMFASHFCLHFALALEFIFALEFGFAFASYLNYQKSHKSHFQPKSPVTTNLMGRFMIGLAPNMLLVGLFEHC